MEIKQSTGLCTLIYMLCHFWIPLSWTTSEQHFPYSEFVKHSQDSQLPLNSLRYRTPHWWRILCPVERNSGCVKKLVKTSVADRPHISECGEHSRYSRKFNQSTVTYTGSKNKEIKLSNITNNFSSKAKSGV